MNNNLSYVAKTHEASALNGKQISSRPADSIRYELMPLQKKILLQICDQLLLTF